MQGIRRPEIRAVMERRLLISYRIEPDAVQAFLPAPFRPAQVGGYAVGSICLIRLAGIRPAGFPAVPGLRAQNVAHRIAVLLDTADGPAPSVYIPSRYTSSRLTALTGSLLFSRLRMARFHADEKDGRYQITAHSRDGNMHIEVDARIAASLPADSVFADPDEASRFFRLAPTGYSATPDPGVFDAVTLETFHQELDPLRVDAVTSSLFGDPRLFPPGTVAVDSAFAATGLATWRPLTPLVTSPGHAIPLGQP